MPPLVQRSVTGTPGLDKMLRGGLIPGRVYAIAGPPGSGKTMIAVQFLLEGVKRGENVLLLALDEPPSEIKENLGLYGGNFDAIFVLDGTLEMKSYEKTPVRDVSIQRKAESFERVFPEIARSADARNPELTASAIQEMLKAEVRNRKITRVAIDSITSLKCFLMTGLERNIALQSFFRFLSDLDATVVVTVQEGGSPLRTEVGCSVEEVMSRGVIRLHRWIQGNGFRLGLSVDKFRGSEHEEQLARVRIQPIGLQVLENQPRRVSGGD